VPSSSDRVPPADGPSPSGSSGTGPVDQPLRGIRVLDLTRVLAGPFATQIMGDLGAEVTKLEAIDGGDEVRGIGPFYPGGESHYFLAINRNKRSVAIDLKSPEGRQVVLDLVAASDVVVENFRPRVMKRLGLDFEQLTARNPSVILLSISGFGSDGPLVDKPSFDLVSQAMSGVMTITGEPDGPPTKLGIPMGDLGGGLWGAIAVLSALVRRHADPRPQHIDLSLLDGLMGLLGYLGQYTMLTGTVPERVGSSHHHVVPYGRFRVKDGHIVLALHVGSFWTRFCDAIGRGDLVSDPRFRDPEGRRQNRDELIPIIEQVLEQRTRAEWDEVLDLADVPFAPILDVAEALAQPQVQAREAVQTFVHPTAGSVDVLGSPVRFVGGERTPLAPPPLLGEHTLEVLRDRLGYDDEQITHLVENGIVAPAKDPAS
jgi:crotonobetainyl-CoA:carnitine CoA-transferase CaiB-like acyl-CoA transferase